MKILVVEDDDLKRLTLSADLTEADHAVSVAGSGEEALGLLECESYDVVITDLKMPGIDGLELLRTVKGEIAPATEVIMMTAYGTIPLAVEAIRQGALDFITKPFDNRQLLPLLARIERRMARKDPAAEKTASRAYALIEKEVMGASPAVRHLKYLIRVCAESDSNVLLVGETGTGKDLVASVIHRTSPRQAHPFVKVSCAMFPENLVESELFGHERGAFTGADQRRAGRLELAQRGTVYLDDVDDIPLKEQVKLLRVIEEKVFERVGSTASINCDVRFIASTKTDLAEKITQGAFREDLYYRLKVIEVHLPPLRERAEDVPELARHLLRRIAGGEDPGLAEGVLGRLSTYDWPGNVRELANTLEQAWIVGRGRLAASSFDNLAGQPGSGPAPAGGFRSAVERTERELLSRALTSYPENKTRAARSIGMKPSTFRDKLRKYGLE